MKKRYVKITLDIVMTCMILIAMGYHLTGEGFHKWLGISLIVLVVIHHILNFSWYRALPHGRYTAARILRTAVDGLLLISLLGTALSGVMLARDIFAFIPLPAGSFARLLHMAATSWTFVLISLHIGLHWGQAVGRLLPLLQSRGTVTAVRALVAVTAVYGCCAFIERGLWQNLFLLNQYVFFDFAESVVLFYVDYIAIVILFAAISYYVTKALGYKRTSILPDKIEYLR